MLFIKELKKICFSFIYVLFIGLLLFSWHENFYGVTTKEITGSQGNEVSISSGLTGGSILEKPEKNKESYGMKNKEVPDKIMCGCSYISSQVFRHPAVEIFRSHHI